MEKLASKIFEGLYSLSEENKECIIDLDSGGRIELDMFVEHPRIIFRSKDPRVDTVGFITYKIRKGSHKTIALLRLVADFYNYSALYKHSFVNLLKMSEENIRKGNTLPFFDFTIEDTGLSFMSEEGRCRARIYETDFEKAKEGLLEFFREITLITEGIELDENLKEIED